ncbi:MAG: Maf family protein, partial [Mesotoga sp.]|nr:Maf family protein [Mesotoga sp.]
NFSFIERTAVKFRKIPPALIGEYVQTGIPLDKAGAYGIQDYGALFTEIINGDYYNVMGLPIGRLWQELNTRGVI